MSAAPQIPESDRKKLRVFFPEEGGPDGTACPALYVRTAMELDSYDRTDQHAGYAIEVEIPRPA